MNTGTATGWHALAHGHDGGEDAEVEVTKGYLHNGSTPSRFTETRRTRGHSHLADDLRLRREAERTLFHHLRRIVDKPSAP